MKRILATIVLALPLVALCVMPKSASAEPTRGYKNVQPPHQVQQARRHKVWVPGHYETVNHHRRWVPGHYEFR